MSTRWRAVLLFLCLLSVQGTSQISVSDSLALVDLYHSTNGDQWQNKSNWLSTAPAGTWFGVQASGGRVVGLMFYWGNNLQGPLPSSLGSLTGLQQLMLGGNRITSIPPEIGNLSNLQSLDLSLNRLKRVPSSLAQLANLTFLNLSQNEIFELPEQIGALTNLRQLSVEHNRITRLPSSIGDLVRLTSLNAMDNSLAEIPDEIANLRLLTHLYLGGNKLTRVPSAICTLDSLQLLWLFSNQLTTLPPEIGNLRKLVNLHLQGNQLQSLPPSIGNLTLLQNLHLADNQLRSLPPEIGNLTRLRSFRAYNNQLDSIPATIGNLTGLVDIWLQRNNLVTLPASIGNLTNLTHLYFDDNRLSGRMPDLICSLPRLVLLSFRDNNLTGPVPECIGQFTGLGWLFLEQNRFDSLPSLAGARSLRVFSVYANELHFADVERNIGLPFTSFSYAPQDSVGQPVDTTLRQGSAYRLDAFVRGTRNRYQWQKNGSSIPGATSSNLVFNSIDSTYAGTYVCKVTSDSIPILEISTRPVRISVDGTVAVRTQETPLTFLLEQNYPNPFNPTTSIKFQIPSSNHVTLKVFDMLGRKVATLVDEVKEAGEHAVVWDASAMASGVFYYQMRTGTYTKTRALTLLK